MPDTTSTIAVIGAGPAGLMAAEAISRAGFTVHVYDAMPTCARKFLMAGVGGMNITHAEPLTPFLSRYRSDSPLLKNTIQQFTPDDLRHWIHQLGIETFVGSSGRVFPKEMKAAPLLRRWLQRLREQGVVFFMRQRWLGWTDDNALLFSNKEGRYYKHYSATVLALGGGSWPQLGSDGAWQQAMATQSVAVNTLKPANCGFQVNWSQVLRQQQSGKPLKNTRFSAADAHGNITQITGECVITDYGIEGGAVYSLSALLRDQLEQTGKAALLLDMAPGHSQQQLEKALSQGGKSLSTTTLLRKKTGISATAIALLYEFHNKETLRDITALAAAIKHTEIPLVAARPLAEAISSAGGIAWDELNDGLMLNKIPGVFCAGEMLDWEAPTGGYLLTACFATGKQAGEAAVDYCRNL